MPYTPEIHSGWESELVADVINYIKTLDKAVNPTHTLYIGVDGVAPMAKIKQQRHRRFKSAITAEAEGRIVAEAKGLPYEKEPRWDTNAITPGTKFMITLANGLRAYARSDPARIIVSPADEPGEGEQKIMEWVRKTKPADIVVYGLDADLIVLALLTSVTYGVNIDLYREEVEFSGGVKYDAFGDIQYLYMNTNHLAQTLFDKYKRDESSTLKQFILDFVGLMNLLGNDFVPHGMTLKIRDDGIHTVLDMYRYALKGTFVTEAEHGFEYSVKELTTLFKLLEQQEATSLLKTVTKKLEARVGATNAKTPEAIALAKYNDSPVLWAAEEPLVQRVVIPGNERASMVLRPDWQTTYDELALWGADPEKAAEVYLEALGWTLAYYTGKDVDMNWVYPWPLPPRYGTLVKALQGRKALPIPTSKHAALKPQEQLAMVLPESSFHLLPSEYAVLPKKYVYMWPKSWGQYSFGRRFLWECEPLVPLITPKQIKSWIEMLYD